MTALADERREIRGLAREFAEAEIAPRAAAWDRDGAYGRDVLEKLGELGFLGMLVPEEYGGLGLDASTYLAALEELARGDASVALAVSIHNGPVARLLMAHGSAAQKSRWLPALASGEKIGGFALSEPDAGSDPGGLATEARRTADGWTMSGVKRWVTNGGRADVVCVFARTDDGDDGSSADPGASPSPRTDADSRAAPIGAFLVETDAEGYRPGRREKTMGLRASETVEVALDRVRLEPDRLVGSRAKGLGHALGAIDLGRLGIAAQAVGIAQAALEHAASYAGQRRQFGRPIAAFGAVRSKLAVMATRIAASRALLMEAARAWESSPPGPSAALWPAMAKLQASETAAWVTDQAVNVLGGCGFMREFPVERLMRDAKATEIYEGTSEILRMVIGRSVTDKGRQAWQS